MSHTEHLLDHNVYTMVREHVKTGLGVHRSQQDGDDRNGDDSALFELWSFTEDDVENGEHLLVIVDLSKDKGKQFDTSAIQF